MTKPRSIATALYFIILLFLAPTNLLSFDTYYYWEWSRHLALSYYAGSPMIAYFIKLSTLLFGNTLFALSFVGIATTALTSWIIYKTARLFLSKDASYITMLLWLFSPLVTMDLLKQTTYDTPLTLFWALSLYYVVKFIKFDKIKELYFIGASIGLMMLSKYSGIVLTLSLLIFFMTSSYRYVFKTVHFYLALLLAMAMFSPVILWNYQHEWQSFLYQLSTHQLSDAVNPFRNIIKSYLTTFLPALNVMLLPPFLCWLKKAHYLSGVTHEKNTTIVSLCRIICTTFMCFYLFTASKASIREYWLAPYLITSALLGGFCFQTFNYRKSAFLLIAVYGVASLSILVNNSYLFNLTTPNKFIEYQLIQKFNAFYPHLPKTILTAGWFEARMLFFLKNNPDIYTIDCGSPQNQYALWSIDVNQKIANKTLKEALYIDPENRITCVEKYFDTCVKLATPTYLYKNREYPLYAYTCTNN